MTIMPTRKSSTATMGKRVHLRPPRRSDQQAFIAAARASRRLHSGWVQAPETPAAYVAYVERYAPRGRSPRYAGFLVVRNEDRPGMVADVTTILGKDHGINIDEMDLGKGPAGDVSLMLLATSTPVPPEVVAQLRETEGVVDARAIELD